MSFLVLQVRLDFMGRVSQVENQLCWPVRKTLVFLFVEEQAYAHCYVLCKYSTLGRR